MRRWSSSSTPPVPLSALGSLTINAPSIEQGGVLRAPFGQIALNGIRGSDEAAGTVTLTQVSVHAYRNDEALVSGPRPGELVVTAGVQKMAPGLRVALPEIAPAKILQQASR